MKKFLQRWKMGVDTYKALAVKELMVSALFGSTSVTPLVVGTGVTSHTLNSNQDFMVSGELEVDGNVYFDSSVRVYSEYRLETAGSSSQVWGGGAYGHWGMGVDDGLRLAVGETDGGGNRNVIITSYANRSKDHDHETLSADPTLFIHSVTDPDTDNTEYIKITHDQTDGNIDCGKGTLNLGATGNVNFAGATKTGTGDTVTDGYVTLEVAGVAVKFATIA
jgi:hypothetical protein